jgi:hypothetical protein
MTARRTPESERRLEARRRAESEYAKMLMGTPKSQRSFGGEEFEAQIIAR